MEAYAVLTRLPPQFRVSPSEAETVLRETIRENARLAPFAAESMWNFMTGTTALPAAGGAAYDAFIIQLLCEAGAEAIVTYNVDDFRRLSPHVRVADPAELPASSRVPPMADRLHLSRRHRAEIEALLRRHLPDVEVWAFGSRVTGRSHDGSALDLVLRGPDKQRVPIDALRDFEDAMRNSNIPFLVEARDWARLPQQFHREIERHHVVLLAHAIRRGHDGE